MIALFNPVKIVLGITESTCMSTISPTGFEPLNLYEQLESNLQTHLDTGTYTLTQEHTP